VFLLFNAAPALSPSAGRAYIFGIRSFSLLFAHAKFYIGMSCYSTRTHHVTQVQYPYNAVIYGTSPTYGYVSPASPSDSMHRYGSSDGSSGTYSTPTSPVFDHASYAYQDDSHYYADQYSAGSSSASASGYHGYSTSEYGTLETVDEEQQGESSQKNRDSPVMCLYPGCDKIFKRRADLDRHYKHRHCADTTKESYRCDYQKCVRRREPFGRRDHYRDHLRDFHKEDIEKRGVTINRDWMEGRNVSINWWRCHKCLARVYVNESQYECPDCKTTCQPERVRRRH
jgi:hypothetical protein